MRVKNVNLQLGFDHNGVIDAVWRRSWNALAKDSVFLQGIQPLQ